MRPFKQILCPVDFSEFSRRAVRVARGLARDFEAQVDLPWGEPGGPTRRADLVAKFQALAAQRICEHRATAIVAAVKNLKNGPLDPLLDSHFQKAV